MALGSTEPLTEMSTRSISWGKGGRCVRLTTLPPSRAVVTKSGDLNFLEPSGPLQARIGTALRFTILPKSNIFLLILLTLTAVVCLLNNADSNSRLHDVTLFDDIFEVERTWKVAVVPLRKVLSRELSVGGGAKENHDETH